jgi:peptide/nickel transport system substrate-binding protein
MTIVAAGVLACVAKPPRSDATVLFASGADLQSINPLVAIHPLAKQVQKHVLFLTLATYDSAFDAVPRLASWEWDARRTMLTFHLRRDVVWHDGVPTTAADVVWTLRAALDAQTAFPRARDLSAVTSVEAVDSFTVGIEFAGPQPRFPDILTDLAILPEHHFAGARGAEIRTHPFNDRPVGNGPFEFVEYRPNQRWVFRRFPEFPDELGTPRLDRFVVVVVDEATTKLAALTSGELDFAGISPAHAEFVRDDPRLTVIDYPVQFAVALVWNLRRAPFDDVQVRRALSLALDRRVLVDAYVYGFGAVAEGPVSPDHPWYEAAPPVAHSRDEAGRILDDLGWKRDADGVRRRQGQPLGFEALMVTGDNALEQMIQAQLRDLGVDMRIRQLELATFLAIAQSSERDFDAMVTGIPGDLSLGYVAAMYRSDEGPVAYPGYRSAVFDAWLRRAAEAENLPDLENAWRSAQRVLAADHPTTWLYHARGVQGVNRRIRGLSIDLRGELATVANWWVADGER